MKRLIFLTIIILSVFASCKDDVATPKYSLDENGDVVVANDNKALRTTDLFNSVVCGHCWEVSNIEYLKDEYRGGANNFLFGKDSCTLYFSKCDIPFQWKSKIKLTYDEISGKLTNDKKQEILTIISINPDNTITAIDRNYISNPSILTLTPMDKEEFKKMDSDVEKTMREFGIKY